MKSRETLFGTDNGTPCTKCQGTIYRFKATIDSSQDDGTLYRIDASCVGCGGAHTESWHERGEPDSGAYLRACMNVRIAARR